MLNLILAVEEGSWWSAWIIDAFMKIWDWIVSSIQGFAGWLMDIMFGLIPTNQFVDPSDLKYYFEIANCWCPLDYGLNLISIYFVFLAGFITVKMVLKLIPTVG